MKKQAFYSATEIHSAAELGDPSLRPAFSLRNRFFRLLWNTCWLFLYRPSVRPMHAWRIFLLKMFGAKMGAHCHFHASARIWAPWNLVCADRVAVAPGAEIYNPAPLRIGSHAIISQGAYICGATHDFNDPAFPLLAYSMNIGAYAWVCARACVAPGVNLGDGAVLGLASVATRDLDPWTVYAGAPAVKVKERVQTHMEESPANSVNLELL